MTEHQTCWKEWYSEEEIFLKNAMPQGARISHIGSTAISSIWAKPIIDILVEVPKGTKLSNYKDLVVNGGYICMIQNTNSISFNKGYTENGFAEKVFHLHLRFIGDNDELYFRDYLIEHPDVASKYEKMKLKLWKEYEHLTEMDIQTLKPNLFKNTQKKQGFCMKTNINNFNLFN